MTKFGNSPRAGRRAAPRVPALIDVEISIGGQACSVALREISRTGAKLSGVSALTEGQELELRAGLVRVVGEVVWCEGSECAVAFDMPIAVTEVRRVRSLVDFVTRLK